MSIAGAGAHATEPCPGGSGLLLGGVPGVAPADVAGHRRRRGRLRTPRTPWRWAWAPNVTIIDRSLPRLHWLDDLFARPSSRPCTPPRHAMEERVARADLVIGAVLVPGAAAPKLVTREDAEDHEAAARCWSDVAIDQGGCFETSQGDDACRSDLQRRRHRPLLRGQHAGLASRAPPRYALNNATLPLRPRPRRARHGALDRADPHLAAGLNVHRGKVTNKAVAESLGAPPGLLRTARVPARS